MADLTLFGASGTFEVQGTTPEGTLIFFDLTGYAHVPASHWKAMVKELGGQTVTLERLREHIATSMGFKRDLSRHVAAILVAEGLATAASADALTISPPQP